MGTEWDGWLLSSSSTHWGSRHARGDDVSLFSSALRHLDPPYHTLLLIINKWHDFFYQSGFCTTANNLGIKVHDVCFILSSVGLLMFIHEAVSLEAFRFFSLCFDNRINDRFCVQRMVCSNGWSWSEKKQCDKNIDFRIPSRIFCYHLLSVVTELPESNLDSR